MRRLVRELRAGTPKGHALRAFLWRERRVVAFLVLATVTFWALYRVEGVASENRQATCALRQNLEQRVADTRAYLDAHPGPEPFPDISRETIQNQVRNQQATIHALTFVDCS